MAHFLTNVCYIKCWRVFEWSGHQKAVVVVQMIPFMSALHNTSSVTRKKLPNVNKSCPKMISLEKWEIERKILASFTIWLLMCFAKSTDGGNCLDLTLVHLPPFRNTKKWILKNGPTPASFSFIFVFQPHYKFYNKNVCEKCPSRIRCQDSN